MKKKIITLVLSLMLCLGVVPSMTACGKKSDVSVFLMVNGVENTFYKQHFEKVSSEMGIKIGYTGYASANYYRLLTGEITKGATPDILYVRPSDVRRFVKEGLIADISSELEAYASTMGRVHEGAKNLYKYDTATGTWGTGGTYAVPKDLSVQQLGYNKKLVYANRNVIYNAFAGDNTVPRHTTGENAGKVKLPWEMDWENENYTWSQYKTMAAALSANGKKLNDDGTLSSTGVYGCDFPSYELLMWSFGGTLLSGDLQTVNLGDGNGNSAFEKAGKYLAALRDTGAANYRGATYDKFVGDKDVCFYGGVNSFDIKNYDTALGEDGWDIMPWPVADATGDFSRVDGQTPDPTDWQGIISSAGYAVSKACKDKARAVKVIMSLLADDVQTSLVGEYKIQLPLFTDMLTDYLDSNNNDVFSPLSRSFYIDVITGENGRTSDVYKSYESTWHDKISAELFEYIYPAEVGDGEEAFTSHYNSTFRSNVQESYNEKRNA